MSSSSVDQQKKLEYLMRKSPNIPVVSPDNPKSEEKRQSSDGTKSFNEDNSATKDKSQKKSFDYSNYIRNKRQQKVLISEEQSKAQMSKEEIEYQNKREKKESELQAKTAKKRMARQKKKNRIMKSKSDASQS